MSETRAGLIALVGEPNAGKSTLLNRLVGSRISIVTHKAQTTRFRVRGVLNEGNAQLIFVDTPGLFNPKSRLDQAMVSSAWKSTSDADVVLLIADVAAGLPDSLIGVVDRLAQDSGSGRVLALALNKIDRASREQLLSAADQTWQPGRVRQSIHDFGHKRSRSGRYQVVARCNCSSWPLVVSGRADYRSSRSYNRRGDHQGEAHAEIA